MSSITKETTWEKFKSYVDSKQLNIQFLDDDDDIYELYAIAEGFVVLCIIKKDDPRTSEQADFEDNYKNFGNKFSPIKPSALADPDGFRFRGRRIISATAAPGESSHDYVLPEDLYFTGVIIKCSNINFYDYGKLQIIAPIGHSINPCAQEILVEEFVPSWGLTNESQMIQVYRAKILSGLIIRIVFNNTGSSNVDFWINAFLHKRT